MTSHFSLFIMIGHTDSRRFFLKYTAIIIVSIKLSYYPIILISWRCSKSKQSCFYLHLVKIIFTVGVHLRKVYTYLQVRTSALKHSQHSYYNIFDQHAAQTHVYIAPNTVHIHLHSSISSHSLHCHHTTYEYTSCASHPVHTIDFYFLHSNSRLYLSNSYF